MKNSLSICALAVASLITVFPASAESDNYQLEQVLMLSRHNLRAPLMGVNSDLPQFTKKAFPGWDVPAGQLTTKGGVLEVYMGHYMREWLVQQGLVKANECPDPERIYAYANSIQRTVATAQFFMTGAFPGCDIPVSHQDQMGEMDPIFNPVTANVDEAFIKQAQAYMASSAAKMALKPAFDQLGQLIDYKNAPACKGKKECTLAGNEDNHFTIENGREPRVTGALKTGNGLVDTFILQYYEGFPADKVAWGQIKTAAQWESLSAIKEGYQQTLFGTPEVARITAAPLIDYMRSLWKEEGTTASPPVIMLVGHDANIASLLSSLDVKPYSLPGQYEATPIGGMVQFQRWLDKKNNKQLVKIEYVYQTTEQLRNATPLSLASPPQRVTLALDGCQVDSNGFCSWDTFLQQVNKSLEGTSFSDKKSEEAPDASDTLTTENVPPQQTATPVKEEVKQERSSVADKPEDQKHPVSETSLPQAATVNSQAGSVPAPASQ
ncbi:MAG: Glucose-1-phosphatase [Candidatus Erwinia impunctatus]|nr:Glucose-1-phosphatase [Culicoides impunctatus]